MLTGLAVVMGVVIAAGAALRGLSWGRRYRMTKAIPEEEIRLACRGVSLRVLVSGETGLPSMSRSKANRTIGDVLVTKERLLVVCSRGVLVDIRPGRGRTLDSARSPGPGRLILEGKTPASQGEPGSYRIELTVDRASDWVEELSRFRDSDNGGFGEALSA